MSALHLVLNEMATSTLPARQRAWLIANLARQYGLNDAVATALQNGDCQQLAQLSNTQTTGCSFIVASNVPATSTGCFFIVATEVPRH
ncbi:hypothetical protein [Rheinheimera texasensis]|uniref:hypothetical protein n=1 Tax=Rheinheimera texasensis TaxID=306205 RepID=UPI0032B27186